MPSPRQLRSIARVVLAWFVLVITVATASPIARPQRLEVICSGAGMLLMAQDGGAPAALGHAMDCPLCLLSAAPPPSSPSAAQPHAPSRAIIVAADGPQPLAALALPPLPPRGPPSRLSFD